MSALYKRIAVRQPGIRPKERPKGSTRAPFNGTAYFDVTFLKDFKFTFNAGVSLDETRSTSVLNPWFGQFASEKGSVSKGHQRNFDLNLQQILNYTKQIGPHNINVIAFFDRNGALRFTIRYGIKPCRHGQSKHHRMIF